MSKKIMLVCSAGMTVNWMSTSLLVTEMKKAAEKDNLDIDIFATTAAGADDLAGEKNPDVVMLGPQVHYMLAEFQKKFTVPIDVIDMHNYGMMDGEKVLKQSLNKIKD